MNPLLTAAQVATLQKVLANANHALPRIEFLEGLAAVNPALADRAKEMRARREYQVQFAETALALNRQLSGK